MEEINQGPLGIHFNGEKAAAADTVALECLAAVLTAEKPVNVRREYTRELDGGGFVTFATDEYEAELASRNDPDYRLPTTFASISIADQRPDNVLFAVEFDPEDNSSYPWDLENVDAITILRLVSDLGETRFNSYELALFDYLRNLANNSILLREVSHDVQVQPNITLSAGHAIRQLIRDNTYHQVESQTFRAGLGVHQNLEVITQNVSGLHELDEDIAVLPVMQVVLDDLFRGELTRYVYERRQSGDFDLDSYPLPLRDHDEWRDQDGKFLFSRHAIDLWRESHGLKVTGKPDVERLTKVLSKAVRQLFTTTTTNNIQQN